MKLTIIDQLRSTHIQTQIKSIKIHKIILFIYGILLNNWLNNKNYTKKNKMKQ